MKIGYLMQAGVPDMRQHPLSGPATHVKHVFDELGNLGHEMCLLAYQDGQIWKSDDLDNFEPVNIPWMDQGPIRLLERFIRRLQSELGLPYAAFFESLRFAMACRHTLSGYDLFYERMGWLGYGGGLAAKWMGIPLVLEVNGDHLSEFELLGLPMRVDQRWLSTALMNRAVSQVSHVVAAGEGWRQRFIERWAVDPSRISVIENGSEMVNLLSREQLRVFQKSGDISKPVQIIYVGAFEPWHGLKELIRAYKKVISQGIAVQLLLMGTGSELDQIEQLIESFNIQEYIALTGHVDKAEMAHQLANSDIGVAPYCGRVEYSGLKLLDYKAAGLATIASGENGQPAVFEHGRTGWIVPPCDENALCEAIIHLATDNNLRRKIGQAARYEAELYHSWQHTAKQLDDLFKKVLGTDSPDGQIPN